MKSFHTDKSGVGVADGLRDFLARPAASIAIAACLSLLMVAVSLYLLMFAGRGLLPPPPIASLAAASGFEPLRVRPAVTPPAAGPEVAAPAEPIIVPLFAAPAEPIIKPLLAAPAPGNLVPGNPVAVAGVTMDPAGVSETEDSDSKSTSGSESDKKNKHKTYNAGSTRHQDDGDREKSSHKSSHKSSSHNHSGDD